MVPLKKWVFFHFHGPNFVFCAVVLDLFHLLLLHQQQQQEQTLRPPNYIEDDRYELDNGTSAGRSMSPLSVSTYSTNSRRSHPGPTTIMMTMTMKRKDKYVNVA
jgi:hypothetical protein